MTLVSAGSTTAFQPAGSDCAERTPSRSVTVAAGSMCRWPTIAVKKSSKMVSSKVSEPVTAPRMSCSVVRCSSRPVSVAPPETVRMRKEGEAKTRLPEVTAEAGTVHVMVSGALVSYSGKAGSVMVTEWDARSRTRVSRPRWPRTTLFQPYSLEAVATRLLSSSARSASSVSMAALHSSPESVMLSVKLAVERSCSSPMLPSSEPPKSAAGVGAWMMNEGVASRSSPQH